VRAALVLRALGLGDLLTAVPGLRGLRRALSDHEIFLACPRRLAPLAFHTGAIDHAVAAAPLCAFAFGPLAEVAVNLHGCGPQSHRLLLAHHPERLIAFEHPEIEESRGLPRWKQEEHEVARWCRLLQECGGPADPGDLRLDPPLIPAPSGASGATVIHPGAAYPARRWPSERWAEIVRVESANGHSVLITGSSSERIESERVAEVAGLSRARVVAGTTDIMELCALVAAAGRVVCGDTGVAHLATAFGVPSVVLFGPTSPALWGPPNGDQRHRALWSGKTGDPHGREVDPGLLEISVAEVLEALEDLPEPSLNGKRS
jgi:ADP-heptose:LPS heptosyltransferase